MSLDKQPSAALLATVLAETINEFLRDFETVFEYDWDFTKPCLEDTQYYINNTFLNPQVEDESNNWANRGALLSSYRRLCRVLGRQPARWQDGVG